MSEKKMVFDVVSCGRDEYPGDGLRLTTKDCPRLGTNGYDGINKHFLSVMNVTVEDGDEIEVTVKYSHELLRDGNLSNEKSESKYVCPDCSR